MNYQKISVEYLGTTLEVLTEIATNLRKVEAEMRENGLDEAYFPWTQRQEDCLEIIKKLARRCDGVLPAQILAKKQNRPSIYEGIKAKSARDMAAREARQKGLPRRPVGRPRKVVPDNAKDISGVSNEQSSSNTLS